MMLCVFFAELDPKTKETIIEQSFLQGALLDLLLHLLELLFDCFYLLLAAHVCNMILVFVASCLYLRLQFFALIIIVFHFLDEFTKLSSKLLLLLCDFT